MFVSEIDITGKSEKNTKEETVDTKEETKEYGESKIFILLL